MDAHAKTHLAYGNQTDNVSWNRALSFSKMKSCQISTEENSEELGTINKWIQQRVFDPEVDPRDAVALCVAALNSAKIAKIVPKHWRQKRLWRTMFVNMRPVDQLKLQQWAEHTQIIVKIALTSLNKRRLCRKIPSFALSKQADNRPNGAEESAKSEPN